MLNIRARQNEPVFNKMYKLACVPIANSDQAAQFDQSSMGALCIDLMLDTGSYGKFQKRQQKL